MSQLDQQSGKSNLQNINDQINSISDILRVASENIDAVVNGNAITPEPKNEVPVESFISLESLDNKLKSIKSQAVRVRDMVFQLRG